MSVLVTGGAGFIGSHIVDALVHQDAKPIVMDNLVTGAMSHVPDHVPFINRSVADPIIADIIEQLAPTSIIHAAAQASVPRSMADPEGDRAINLVGTANVIDGARRLNQCRVVFLSTGGGIYGDTIHAADESTLPQPKSFYSAHKYVAERYLEYSGIPYAIARLANVYGPRQRSDLEGGVVSIFAERIQRGEGITIYGSGDQLRDFVHVDDVVSAILTMLTSDKNGTWNVGTGLETSVNELLSAMLRQVPSPITVTKEPPRAGDVFRSCLNIEKIQRELHWQPQVTLDAGVRSMMQEVRLAS